MREIKYRLDLTHNYLKIDAGKEFYLRPNDDNTQKIFMLPQSYTINCRRLLLRETCLTPQWYLDLLYYVDDSDTRSDNDIIEEVFKFSTFDVSMDSDNVSTSGQTVFVEGVNGNAPWFSGVIELISANNLVVSSIKDHIFDWVEKRSFTDAMATHRVSASFFSADVIDIMFQPLYDLAVKSINQNTGDVVYYGGDTTGTTYRLETSTHVDNFELSSFPRGASFFVPQGLLTFIAPAKMSSYKVFPAKNVLMFRANDFWFIGLGDTIQYSVVNLSNRQTLAILIKNGAWTGFQSHASLGDIRVSY